MTTVRIVRGQERRRPMDSAEIGQQIAEFRQNQNKPRRGAKGLSMSQIFEMAGIDICDPNCGGHGFRYGHGGSNARNAG